MLVLILALSAVATTVSANPSGSVTCTDTQYTPVITYTSNAGVITDLKLYIGADTDAGGDATCTKTESNVAASTLKTLTYTALTMASQTCDGVVLTADATTIKFEATATLEVTETFRSKIKRDTHYTIKIECSLTRAVTGLKADGNVEKWTVNRAAVSPTTGNDVTGTINFPITIKYYTDDNYNTEVADPTAGGGATKTFVANMGSMLYIQLKEEPVSTIFKFVTNKCYFNYVTTTNGVTGSEDTFFENRCMADKTSANNDFTDVDVAGTEPNFDMKVKAFFFTGQENTAVHLWCEVMVCLTAQNTGDCVQTTRSDCNMVKRRRRRDADPKEKSKDAGRRDKDEYKKIKKGVSEYGSGVIETRIIESKQMILLDKNDIFVPSCGKGFIYDRVTKGCSNTNLVDFIGVYLDIPWNNDYANKSSLAYKNLAVEKAYQLYAMVQMSEAKNHIVGLEVVEAKKGSVILTVRVKYSAMSNADAAFEGFARAIQNVDQTRVANILNIRKEKVIEFVEVKPASSASQINNLTLIILVVVLCAAVLIALAAVWKVKMARRAPNTDMPQVKGHVNPTLETVS